MGEPKAKAYAFVRAYTRARDRMGSGRRADGSHTRCKPSANRSQTLCLHPSDEGMRSIQYQGMSRRSTTVAFRISVVERALIDEQAVRCGITNSEYARRAVVHAARVDAAAIEEAREEGRAQVHAALRHLQDELAQAHNVAAGWRQKSLDLAHQLTQSSEDLLSASRAVLVGDAAAKVKVATIWARLVRRQRVKLLPIVAAAAEREFEQSVRLLPTGQAWLDAGLEFLEGLRWLIDALDPDAGDEYRSRTNGSRHDGPLEGALKRLAEVVLLHVDVIEREPEAAPVELTDPREDRPAWAEGLVWGFSQ
jgi:hypothetical protein